MRPLRHGVIAVILTFAVVACGATGPTPAPAGSAGPDASTAAQASTAPSAQATPAPTPTPTPEPVDVAALTEAAVAQPTFTANVDIAGTSTLGKVKATTTGTLEIDGRATHMVRTTKTGKSKVKVETITANGTRYAKQKGVWVELGASKNTELIALVRTTTTMTDLGVETKDGQSLNHLQATLPGVPTELALGGDAEGATATLDAWVTADGTPVTMTVTATWTQEVGGKTVDGTKTTTFTFSNVGGAVDVAAPEMVWAFHTSKRYGYRMACPVAWTYEKGASKQADACYDANEAIYSSRARQSNTNLSYLTSKMAGQLRSFGYKSVKITSNKKWRLDGVPARKIEYSGTTSGDKIWGQAIYAIKGAWWYLIISEDFEKTTSADRALFKQMAGTFDFK